MDNKYLFRVYHMGSNGDIFSPFLSGDAKGFGKIEKAHEERYRKLLESVKNQKVFNRQTKIVWE